MQETRIGTPFKTPSDLPQYSIGCCVRSSWLTLLEAVPYGMGMALGAEMDTEMNMKMNTDILDKEMNKFTMKMDTETRMEKVNQDTMGVEMDRFIMEMDTEMNMKVNTDVLSTEMDRFATERDTDTVDLAAGREIDLLR